MSGSRISLGPLAGALALAMAVAVAGTELAHGGSGATTASTVLAALGGGLPLWQSRQLAALVASDALLAGAVLVDVFGLGALFVFPLVALLVATAQTPANQPQPRHLAPSPLATGFAAGPARRSGRLRAAGEAVSRRLLRPSEPGPESLPRTA